MVEGGDCTDLRNLWCHDVSSFVDICSFLDVSDDLLENALCTGAFRSWDRLFRCQTPASNDGSSLRSAPPSRSPTTSAPPCRSASSCRPRLRAGSRFSKCLDRFKIWSTYAQQFNGYKVHVVRAQARKAERRGDVEKSAVSATEGPSERAVSTRGCNVPQSR